MSKRCAGRARKGTGAKFGAWINEGLPHVVDDLEKSIVEDFSVMAEDGLDLAGRNDLPGARRHPGGAFPGMLQQG
jgi:hypothetical protein